MHNTSGLTENEKKGLLRFLSSYVTERRLEKMEKILSLRTDYITVVLEDIFQPHNASAVLRSCDAFGVQDVHIIENRNSYRVNPGVSLGSSQWLTLKRYNENENNTLSAIEKLKEGGYRIVATTPHTNQVSLEEFDLSEGRAALFFGTELTGLSREVLDNADSFMLIPMYGFVESFNISVSCAITLHYLTHRLRNSSLSWHLNEERRLDIMLDWLRGSIKRSEDYEKLFFKKV